MNKNKNPVRDVVLSAAISASAAIILASIIAVIYFFALRNDFNFTIGHFENGSVLSALLLVAIILSVVVSAAAAVFSQKKASITSYPEPRGAFVFFAVFAAVMALFTCTSTISDIMSGAHSSKLKLISEAALPFISATMIFLCVPRMRTSHAARICSIISVFSINLYILACYFDQTLPINSPVRNTVLLAQISFMLFFLSETRLTFGFTESGGKPSASRALMPFFIFACSSCGAITTGVSAGALLFELTTKGHPELHPSMYRLAMYAAVGILAVIRAFSVRQTAGQYRPVQAELDDVQKSENIPENDANQDTQN